MALKGATSVGGGSSPIVETPGGVQGTAATDAVETQKLESDTWVAPRRERGTHGDARARLRRAVISSGLSAAMSHALKAGGTEYLHSRQYVEGDEGRHIDWKASARTQKLQTKVFSEDPEPAVLMVIPQKNWGKTTLHERERRRHFEQVAALLGFSAENHKTPFGVMVYSDKTEMFRLADGTASSTDGILDKLSAMEPPAYSKAVDDNPSLVGQELKALKGRPAVIFYCCDRPDDPIPPELLALGRQHELVRLTITPDRLSTSQPAMLRVMGGTLSGKDNGIQSRRATEGQWDELLAQRLLDRQPVTTDATPTLKLSVADRFDRQLVDFFRRKR